MNHPQLGYVSSQGHVEHINRVFTSYPPHIELDHPVYPERKVSIRFPYSELGLEYVISNCVKAAASGTSTTVEEQEFIKQTFYELQQFPWEVNQEFVERLNAFIRYLRTIFMQYRWYDEYGSCPWRFVGFAEPTFDLKLRRA